MVLFYTVITCCRLAEAFEGGMQYYEHRAKHLSRIGVEAVTAAKAVEDPDVGIAARAARGERANFKNGFFAQPVRQLIKAGWAHDP
eukprot:COSAG01_NODE_23850_length_799_cov_2.164286_1_plen_85_part_10